MTEHAVHAQVPDTPVGRQLPGAGELVALAATALGTREVPGTDTRLGRTAAAVVAPDGSVYLGVSIRVQCGMGFCAEHGAAAALVTAGGSQVTAVAAVRSADDPDDPTRVEVLPPCGRCREFLRQLDPRNLDARVLLPGDRWVTLAELLPEPWEPSASKTLA